MIRSVLIGQQATNLLSKNFTKFVHKSRSLNQSFRIEQSFLSCTCQQQSSRGFARGSSKPEDNAGESTPSSASKSSSKNDDNSEEDHMKHRRLMDAEPFIQPNFFQTLRNFFTIQFVLTVKVDKNFSFQNFLVGARQALLTVSGHLAHNQLDNLEGLVEKKALEEIRENYEHLSVAERSKLEVLPTDAFSTAINNVEIETMREGFTGTHKHIVRILVACEYVFNLKNIKDPSQPKISTRKLLSEIRDRRYIYNFEFKREYIDGHEPGDWIITRLLHIRSKDIFRPF